MLELYRRKGAIPRDRLMAGWANDDKLVPIEIQAYAATALRGWPISPTVH